MKRFVQWNVQSFRGHLQSSSEVKKRSWGDKINAGVLKESKGKLQGLLCGAAKYLLVDVKAFIEAELLTRTIRNWPVSTWKVFVRLQKRWRTITQTICELGKGVLPLLKINQGGLDSQSDMFILCLHYSVECSLNHVQVSSLCSLFFCSELHPTWKILTCTYIWYT